MTTHTLGANRAWLPRAGLIVALLAYWLLELRHLAVAPRAYEDEAWIASTSWKLAAQGVFGTDIQGNYYGMAQHYFGFMPLYPLLQAAVFRAAGLGLWQARLTSVYLGLLVLVFTFALGRRLFGAPTGLLAVAGLLLVRTAGLTTYRLSGILFLDLARLGRYDIAVPVFGLAACLALGRAEPGAGRKPWAWAVLAGVLGGLAGLAHVYGWFWLAALSAAVVHRGLRRRAARRTALTLGALALGAALVILPYSLYVLSAWTDWLGQMAEYSDRMALLDLGWYARNTLTEAQRYGPGLSADWHTWLRPGLALALVVAAPAAVVTLRRADRSLLTAAFGWALVTLPALLALLITSKVANYLLLFLPVAAIALAGGVSALWRAARVRPWLRGALLLACAAVALEGVSQWVRLDQAAAQTTSFDRYAGELRAAVDAAAPDPRPAVLGLHTFWFAFSDLPYTTWYYPTALAQTPFTSVAVPLNATLAQLAPDIVLVDARMRTYLTTPTDNPGPALIDAWLAEDYTWVAAVDDGTYGRTDLYRRRAPGDGP